VERRGAARCSVHPEKSSFAPGPPLYYGLHSLRLPHDDWSLLPILFLLKAREIEVS